MHIAIAGNIGSGKTTLTTLLSKHFGWKPHYEAVDDNPYLVSFYDDMQRWAFNLQIYFLNSRFRQILDIRNSGENVVQDSFKGHDFLAMRKRSASKCSSEACYSFDDIHIR